MPCILFKRSTMDSNPMSAFLKPVICISPLYNGHGHRLSPRVPHGTRGCHHCHQLYLSCFDTIRTISCSKSSGAMFAGLPPQCLASQPSQTPLPSRMAPAGAAHGTRGCHRPFWSARGECWQPPIYFDMGNDLAIDVAKYSCVATLHGQS